MTAHATLNATGTKEFAACWKCGGSGYLPGLEFSDNARCWGCNATGGSWVTVGTLARREARRERDAARRAEKAAAKVEAFMATRDAEWAAWTAENQDVLEFIEAARAGEPGTFIWDMKFQVREEKKALTERQTAAVRRIMEKTATEAAVSSPVIEGRIEVTGEVISVKEAFSAYGSTLKMLVRDDRGFKVWGTLPSAIAGEGCTGKRVTFTATVRASDDDAAFGFYQRPTKARLVS